MKIANPTAQLGENIACVYLQNKGYTIVERNFRQGYGEIDIIASYKETLVFVEVKTRKSQLFGTPLEAITPRKVREVTRTVQFYKHLHPAFPEQLRIDAISVLLNADNKLDTIEHVENIG